MEYNLEPSREPIWKKKKKISIFLCVFASFSCCASVCILAYPRCTGCDNNKQKHNNRVHFTGNTSADFTQCFVFLPMDAAVKEAQIDRCQNHMLCFSRQTSQASIYILFPNCCCLVHTEQTILQLNSFPAEEVVAQCVSLQFWSHIVHFTRKCSIIYDFLCSQYERLSS